MKGRTVILVSHHVQLCGPKAKYIVSDILLFYFLLLMSILGRPGEGQACL